MPNVLWVDCLRIFGSLVLRKLRSWAGKVFTSRSGGRHENERKNDEADNWDIDGKMITANDENAPPTLTSLKSSQWNGTKVKVRTAGKTLGKTVRVFKYGNGWIHATLHMNKPGPTSWS